MLRVEQHALALRDEERDGLGDHREVLLARDAHDLLDVRDGGLADQRAHRREGLREDPQPLVVVGSTSRRRVIPKATISRVLEMLLGEQPEELLLLRV